MSIDIINRRRAVSVVVGAAVLIAGLAFVDRADAGSEPPGEGIAAVFIAYGGNFPDALGVGPIAAINGAPIILVPKDPPLDTATEAELIRLDPRNVAIVGGTGVISTATEDALEALLPNAFFERIAGGNRYVTNALLSTATFPVETVLSVPPVAFIAHPYTDSATISSASAYGSVPLYATVHLPDGAKIVSVTLQADDDDGGDGVGVRLRARGLFSDILIADAFSGDVYAGGEASVTDSTLEAGTEIVNNSLYGYYLEVYASGATRKVIGVYVTYQLGAP